MKTSLPMKDKKKNPTKKTKQQLARTNSTHTHPKNFRVNTCIIFILIFFIICLIILILYLFKTLLIHRILVGSNSDFEFQMITTFTLKLKQNNENQLAY